jgi:hypothetical protein
VVDIEHLIIEALQGPLGQRYQADRKFETGKPRRRLNQMRDVVEVGLNFCAPPVPRTVGIRPTAV